MIGFTILAPFPLQYPLSSLKVSVNLKPEGFGNKMKHEEERGYYDEKEHWQEVAGNVAGSGHDVRALRRLRTRRE